MHTGRHSEVCGHELRSPTCEGRERAVAEWRLAEGHDPVLYTACLGVSAATVIIRLSAGSKLGKMEDLNDYRRKVGWVDGAVKSIRAR